MQTQVTHQGFAAGLRLVPESLRLVARMRNVWLVMVLFAALHSYSRMGFRPEGNGPGDSFVKLAAATAQARRSAWTLTDDPWAELLRGWQQPLNTSTDRLEHVVPEWLRGWQRPLNTRFAVVQNAVIALADVIFGPQDPYAPPRGPWLSFEILLANLLYAMLSAGMLGWIKLALEAKPLSLSNFVRSVLRVTGPIYCWFLLLDAVKLLLMGVEPMLEHSRVTGETLQAAVLVLLLPFAFMPFVLVAWGKSIVTAFPASWRVFTSRVAMLLGFLIVFRVVAEACLILSTALHDYGVWVVSSHVGRFAVLFAANLTSAVAALLLCTALMLIVLRIEPQPAEAAPA